MDKFYASLLVFYLPTVPVSYTHLDVYKRQPLCSSNPCNRKFINVVSDHIMSFLIESMNICY